MIRRSTSAGQTIIALLVFMLLSITLTLSATAIVIINTQGDTGYQNGEQALMSAQTGIENALLRLERDSTYAGETMTLNGGTVTINVSGSGVKTLVATSTYDNFVRTVTATVTMSSNGTLSLTNWSETP